MSRSIAGVPTILDEADRHLNNGNQAAQAAEDARAQANAIRNQGASQQPQGGQR